MTPEERAHLQALDAMLRAENVHEQIRPIVNRVRADLVQKKEALMAWETIPLTVFGNGLPPKIQSAWVFVLRAGADTGAERHPNSHQRMTSCEGVGDMKTGEPGNWLSNALVSEQNAPLEARWISIPPNTWHRPVVGKDTDWTVVSFHTVAAEELIEERPDDGERGTKQMNYLAESKKAGSSEWDERDRR
jgi:hypothetical protein